MISRRCLAAGPAALVLFVVVSPAFAQSEGVIPNSHVQFDFVNPGARSLSMGGAFVGLPDDATAAFTNPAGLLLITRTEVSIEGRGWSFNTPFTVGGHVDGQPTGLLFDTVPGVVQNVSRSTTTALAFISFVYPRKRWAAAAYRQQLSDFTFQGKNDGLFLRNPIEARTRPSQDSVGLKIARYGLSGAYKLNDRLSLGAGLVLYDFELTATSTVFRLGSVAEQFYGAPDFTLDNVTDVLTQSGHESRAAATVGFTAGITSRVSLGAVFHQGTQFDVHGKDNALTGVFVIPDTFAVGVSVYPFEAFRVGVDYDRVEYSELRPVGYAYFDSTQLRADDANELHAGAEYVFVSWPGSPSIRGGGWYDPDHDLRYTGTATSASSSTALITSAFFQPGKNVVHGSIGAGVAIGRTVINAAGDFSSRTNTFSLSAVLRF